MDRSESETAWFVVGMIGRSSVLRSRTSSNLVRITPASEQLLAVLVAAGPAGLATDRLADELWGEGLPSSWRASLRMAVSRLRRLLPDEAISTEGSRVRLDLDEREVDVWRLEQFMAAGSDAELPASVEHLLHSPNVYPGVEISPLIDESLHRVAAAQRHTITQLVETQTDPLPRSLLASLRLHVEADPFDSLLAQTVARAHADAGLGSLGIDIFERSLEIRREAFGSDLESDAGDFVESIRRSSAEPEPREARQRPAARMPSLLARMADDVVVGPLANESTIAGLVALPRGTNRSVVVQGRSGSGKTRLLAKMAEELVAAGVEVVYVPAGREAAAPYANFFAAFPTIGAELSAVLADTGVPSAVKQSTVLNRVLGGLLERAEGRQIALLVDDAQWFDSQERRLLDFLMRSQIEAGSLVVVAGREDAGSTSWGALRQSVLALSHVEVHDVESFDNATVRALIDLKRPELSPIAAALLADQLLQASDGVAGIARTLLGWVDNSGALMPADPADDQVASLRKGLEQRLSIAQLDFLSRCAVKGLAFTLDDAQRLVDGDEDEVLQLVDDLLDLGVLVESSALDTFRFEHLLLVEAAWSRLSRADARAVQLRAAAVTTDPHDRAQHLAKALPSGSAEIAASALFESAVRHAAAGSYGEAVSDLELIEGRCGRKLTAEQRVLFASSLARVGRFELAREQRKVAYDLAVSTRTWSAAVDACWAGLPEAELPGQEQDRVAMVVALLDAGVLDEDLSWRANVLLARQAALCGQHDLASRAVRALERLAHTPSHRSELRLARRHSATFEHPVDRLAAHAATDVDEVDDDVDRRLGLLIYQAIDFLEAGDVAASRATHQQLVRVAIEADDPLRVWYAMMFETVFASLQGDWDAHRAGVERAFDHAQRYGIAAGATARIAQHLLAAWSVGLLELVPGDVPPMDAEALILERAGRALLLDAKGDRDGSMALIDGVLADLRRGADPYSVAVSAMIAEVVSRTRPRQDADLVASILLPRCGSGVVVGGGLGFLGPVDRYVAELTVDPIERAAHLERATDLATQWEMPFWIR